MGGITNPAEIYFKDGLWGWDGSQWRRLPLLWGYTSRLVQNVSAVSTGAADTYVSGTAVPTGEIWIVQSATLRHSDTAASRVIETALVGGTLGVVVAYGSLAAWVPLVWNGGVALAAGDYVRGHGVSIASGQTLYLAYWGYKMSIS